jgi:hypothetical protein
MQYPTADLKLTGSIEVGLMVCFHLECKSVPDALMLKCCRCKHIVVNMTIARQRFGKHVPAAKNKRGIVHC